MVIDKTNFPIYACMILLSLILGALFIYIYLRKQSIEKKYVLIYILMMVIYSIICGIVLDSIINKRSNSVIGLSSYGGAIGVILSAIIFEKMHSSDGLIIKSAIISLPLIYSISKIGCFLAGCCYGIPFNGAFSVTYTAGLNIPLVPVQLLETIVFMLIFIVCVLFRKKYRIIGITLVLSAIGKFLLDFLRYSHLNEIISTNQIISITFIIIGIVLILKPKIIKK